MTTGAISANNEIVTKFRETRIEGKSILSKKQYEVYGIPYLHFITMSNNIFILFFFLVVNMGYFVKIMLYWNPAHWKKWNSLLTTWIEVLIKAQWQIDTKMWSITIFRKQIIYNGVFITTQSSLLPEVRGIVDPQGRLPPRKAAWRGNLLLRMPE